jgi:hypothetical protein
MHVTGLALLRFLARQDRLTVVNGEAIAPQFPEGSDQTIELLTRREVIEQINGGYRFRVELIRRWFAQEKR